MNIEKFLDKYGRDTTTHFYLSDIIKEQNLKYNIIMIDEMVKYLHKDNNYYLIIYLQTSNKKDLIGFYVVKNIIFILINMVLFQ